VNGNIVWLASYPKSGNTWLRTFISNLISNNDHPVHINDILGQSAGDRTVFDAVTGIDSSNLFPDEVDEMRPELYKRLSRETDGFRWIKVHDAYRYLAGQRPIFQPEATRCTLYLVRNPLDVAWSFSRHMAMDIDEAIRSLNDNGYSINRETMDVTGQLDQKLSSWSEHVLSWANAPAGMNLQVMRYEDMKASPLKTFTTAVRALGIMKTQKEIQQALEYSSFATLREMELEAGFREKPAHSEAFFREGKIGAGRAMLTQAQVATIVTKHKEMMQYFGYLDKRGAIPGD
jgi:aryl sulfotransferase